MTLAATIAMIAAIFDVDGTLLRPPSAERRFVYHLARSGTASLRDLAGVPIKLLTMALCDRKTPARACGAYLAGKRVESVLRLSDELFRRFIAPHLWQAGVEKLKRHREMGDLIVLLSGMPDFLLLSFKSHLGAHVAIGTKLEVRGGEFTGKTCEHVSGAEKARQLARLQQAFNIDLAGSYGYGNDLGDYDFLRMVGHPVAVNPCRKLRAKAGEANWPIEHFWS